MTETISCGRCKATWTGASRAHCGGCHETFSSVKLHTRHRTLSGGDHGRCLDPATLPGIEFRDGMWREPEMTEEQKVRAFGRAS